MLLELDRPNISTMPIGKQLAGIYRIILPGIILQSVLVGGGFATGREIVEYGAKFGSYGWISGVFIFFGFTIMSILSFEACRTWKTFDYKSLLKRLTGKGWILFELIYIPLALITIAVMASAAGEILNETLNIDVWLGISTIIVLVAILNFQSDSTIANMKTIGTFLLIAAYTYFGITVWFDRSDEVIHVFSSNTHPENVSLLTVAWTGILYVGYNLGVYPASFFVVKGLSSKRDSIIAGISSGLLMSVPWFLTYIAILGFYPDPNILQAPVPWLRMLEPYSLFYVGLFGLVVGWTLVETATGVIHAFLGRLENDLKEKNFRLKRIHRMGIAMLALLAAMALSSVGIINLIARGYLAMAYGMILVFAVPLLYHAKKILFSK